MLKRKVNSNMNLANLLQIPYYPCATFDISLPVSQNLGKGVWGCVHVWETIAYFFSLTSIWN